MFYRGKNESIKSIKGITQRALWKHIYIYIRSIDTIKGKHGSRDWYSDSSRMEIAKPSNDAVEIRTVAIDGP